MKKPLALAALALALWMVPGAAYERAQAEKTHVMKVATLIPRSSSAVLRAKKWNKRIMDATNGRLKVRVYYGGTAGGESDVIRKMRMGQIDAAAVTTTGLSKFIPEVLVLSAPGLFDNYAQLDAVREELAPQFEKAAAENGFMVLGWGDVGRLRLFSKKPIKHLEDFRHMRPWVWTDSPVMKEFYEVIGATGVPMDILEVYGGLQTGMIDVVFSSAIGALGLQWYTQTDYVSADGSGYVNGAFVLAKKKFDSFPKDVGQALLDISEKYNDATVKELRRADKRAYNRMLERNLKAVEVEDPKKWEQVGKKLRKRLVGRVYTAKLLEKVEGIVAKH